MPHGTNTHTEMVDRVVIHEERSGSPAPDGVPINYSHYVVMNTPMTACIEAARLKAGWSVGIMLAPEQMDRLSVALGSCPRTQFLRRRKKSA